jgi:hypothetical protein
VGAGDGDSFSVGHESGQHFGSVKDGYAPFPGLHRLRIIVRDGRRNYDELRSFDVLRTMSQVHDGALRAESLDRFTVGQIGTGHFASAVEQLVGDGTHAGATDTDEVEPTMRTDKLVRVGATRGSRLRAYFLRRSLSVRMRLPGRARNVGNRFRVGLVGRKTVAQPGVNGSLIQALR